MLGVIGRERSSFGILLWDANEPHDEGGIVCSLTGHGPAALPYLHIPELSRDKRSSPEIRGTAPPPTFGCLHALGQDRLGHNFDLLVKAEFGRNALGEGGNDEIPQSWNKKFLLYEGIPPWEDGEGLGCISLWLPHPWRCKARLDGA